MFGEILTAILRPENKEDQLVSNIANQNQTIQDEIFILQNSLQKLPMTDILQSLEESPQPKSATYLDEEPAMQTIRTLQNFYEMCKDSQKQSKKCQYLIEESTKICKLANDYDLLDTFALFETFPEKDSLQYIKNLIDNLERQLMDWHNKQNINIFEAEQGEMVQQWTNVIAFVQKYKDKSKDVYRSMVERSYSIKKSDVLIYSEYIHTVWQQNPEFLDNFLWKLQNALNLLISYDINSRQYTILIYQLKQEENIFSLTQQTKIMFQNLQIGLHLQAILISIDNLKLFLDHIQETMVKDKKYKIDALRKQLMTRYKEYFQHMIPYLPMDKRRVFMQMMTFGGEGNQMTVYELLVNLKAGRQDADIMVGTIRQILERMQTSKQTVNVVLSFLDLAKQNKTLYSTVMFISDQMIEGLEEQEVNEDKMKVIKQLLSIREEMRVKIHYGQ